MPNSQGSEPLDGDTLECWSVLAALAGLVPRVQLGSLVSSVTYRHPAVLANIVAAVDQISGGRLILGVGAGWQLNEHAAYGIELGTVRERLDRFAEAVQILRSLLDEPRTTFEGQYFRLADAPNQPPPVGGRLPLLVGGAGEQRTMRIAARYADHWNCWSTPELLAHKVSVLRAHCAEVGRDAADIRVSTQAALFLSTDTHWLAQRREQPAGRFPMIIGTPAEVREIVGQYEAAGADELIVPDFTLGSAARKKDTCDLFIEEVASAFR
jgi:alkanesulfonate monooxygenase SsuD/methylene tetrahydromethanopterin reductase-like flavin-dependent oxidoreductase (luciferase family)